MSYTPDFTLTKILDGGELRTNGLRGHVSWERLEGILHKSGDVHDGEKVVQFEVNAHGISFVIERE